MSAPAPIVVSHGSSDLTMATIDAYNAEHVQDVHRWGVLTIGTGLGNARFTNKRAAAARR